MTAASNRLLTFVRNNTNSIPYDADEIAGDKIVRLPSDKLAWFYKAGKNMSREHSHDVDIC